MYTDALIEILETASAQTTARLAVDHVVFLDALTEARPVSNPLQTDSSPLA